MQLYIRSHKLVVKGILKTEEIISTAKQCMGDSEMFEEYMRTNAPELFDIRPGLYNHKDNKFWHGTMAEPEFADTTDDDYAHIGGGDGTEYVYVGDHLYEPNNDELNLTFETVVLIPSKNKCHAAKNRAMGLVYCNAGDQGTGFQYITKGKGKGKRIVAFLLA